MIDDGYCAFSDLPYDQCAHCVGSENDVELYGGDDD